MTFWLSLLSLVLVYGAGGVAAAWLQKRLALTSVAHASIVGSGAYTYVMVSQIALPNSWIPLGLGVLGGTATGILLTLFSQRSRGDDFALLSFAFQIFWLAIVLNARGVTRGALGFSGAPLLPLFSVDRNVNSLLWAVAMLGCLLLCIHREENTWFGVGTAISSRSNELAATLGLSSWWLRLQAGAFYGGFLGFAGCLLASLLSYVGPGLFSISVSVVFLALAYLGSSRPLLALPGAVVLVGVPELLRLLGLSAVQGSYLRNVFAGLSLVAGSLLLLNSQGREGSSD